MRTKRTLIAAVVAIAFAGSLAVGGPAQAGDDNLRASDGVLHECAYHPYSYSSTDAAIAYTWSMDVIVRGPDGLEVTNDYLYDEPATGTGRFQLCSGDPAGRYTLTATGEACDSDYNCYNFSLPGSTFRMRKPRTKTFLTATPTNAHKGQVVKFKVTSKEERPRGYFPNEYATVKLQIRHGGKWKLIRGSRDLHWIRVQTSSRSLIGGQRPHRATTAGAGKETAPSGPQNRPSASGAAATN
jgi:hypothetical protein